MRWYNEILGDYHIERILKNSLAIVCSRKDEKDAPEIGEFLDDLGKYEKIVNGIGYLVKSLGLNNSGIKFYEITKDDITYEKDCHPMKGLIFYIRIDQKKRPEERREFTEEQLRSLIENVDKYYTLKDSLRLLKALSER